MSKNGDLIEASLFCEGVNTYPSIMDSSERLKYLSTAVNRSAYRKINDTRPPFREVHLSFESQEDEYIFRNAAVTAMKFYEGEPPLFSSFLIISVGDRLLAGYIRGNSLDFIRIYKGLDPQYHFQFFCKALNILTINNGKTPGLYWTGNPSLQAKFIYQSAYTQNEPMMVSNICVYAFGRLFPATEENLLFGGDYIYAQGVSIEKREAVLSFKESTYPTSGDGFGAPAEMGVITNATVLPQSNTIYGYGDIIVFCRNGAFSISPNRKLRNEWTTDPEMQKHVFTGKGCVGPNAVANFKNQTFYRDCDTGISSFNLDVSMYQNGRDFADISRPIDQYSGFDSNSENIMYTSAVSSDRRLLVSTCHRREISKEMGVHRFGMGIISACIQQDSANNSMVWEGLWTGIRPTAMQSVNIGSTKKVYIASYDSDKQNRIYVLEERMRGDDILLESKTKRIKSKFSLSSIFSDIGQPSVSNRKQLKRMDILLLKAKDPKLTFTYSADSQPNRHESKVQLTETQAGFKGGFSTYNGLSSDLQMQSPNNTGYFFDLFFDGEGSFEIGKIVIGCSIQNAGGFEEVANTCTKRKSPEFNTFTFGSDFFQETKYFDYSIYPFASSP